jgi:hypothetical protein
MSAYVYTITSPDGSEVYVGSTTQQPHIRWGKHRCDYQATVDGKRKGMCSSFGLFERYGYYACIFRVVEETTVEERMARERHWIDTVATLNIERPTLNDDDAKQKRRESSRRYAENHPDKVKERSRKYAEEHKEQKATYFKAYYEATKQTRKEKFREWYATVGKEEVICECGQSYTVANKSRHLRSKHHTDYLTSK